MKEGDLKPQEKWKHMTISPPNVVEGKEDGSKDLLP